MRILSTFFYICIIAIGFSSCKQSSNVFVSDEEARIFPDYSHISIPANMAPLNFEIEGNTDHFWVKIYAKNGTSIELKTQKSVQIPLKKWQKFIAQNAGKDFYMDILYRSDSGWVQYKTITNHISKDTIDPYLVYRIVNSGDGVFSFLGIFERNLANFEERVIVDNSQMGESCVNCHTFSQNDPSTLLFHLRMEKAGTVIFRNGTYKKINNTQSGDVKIRLVYPAWHPGKHFIAFSTNRMLPFYYSGAHGRYVDSFEDESDIVLYDLENNTIINVPQLTTPGAQESFPTWSPDGKYLYYCRYTNISFDEKATVFEKMPQIKYDLMRIAFDEKTQSFGAAETVIDSKKTHTSVSIPRISPNGRFLLYCETASSTFPTWQKDSDLRMLDLQTGKIDSLTQINSSESESAHSWSNNGRWFVFSSKRLDGQYTQLYIAYVDSNGKVSKPFLIPQKTTDFYKKFMRSFNLPELVTGPVLANYDDLIAAGCSNPEPTQHQYKGDLNRFDTIRKTENNNNTELH